MNPRKFLAAIRQTRSEGHREATGRVVQVDPFRVQFDGEPGAEAVEFPRLDSYAPNAGDRVALLRYGKTWLVIGRTGIELVGARMPPGSLVTKVQRTSAQNISHNTNTAISLDTQVYVPFGGHSTSSNPTRVVPPWSGWWEVQAFMGMAGDSNGLRRLHVAKNGVFGNESDVELLHPGGSTRGMITFATDTFNGEDDYFEVVTAQTSGVTLTVDLASVTLVYRGPDLTDDDDV